MAANFNIMPAALLETKSKYAVIFSQLPVALVMLAIHAGGRYHITPERVAINQDDARIPDNEGNHLMYGVPYTLDKKYPGVGGALH